MITYDENASVQCSECVWCDIKKKVVMWFDLRNELRNVYIFLRKMQGGCVGIRRDRCDSCHLQFLKKFYYFFTLYHLMINKKLTLIFLFFLSFSGVTTAHPGNTDVWGCHTCYTDCASWDLYINEYHCHEDYNGTPPTSYWKYAPEGSCEEEKERVNTSEDELHELEADNLHIKEEVVAQFPGATSSQINAIVFERSQALSLLYNDEYLQYSTRFDMYNSCLEEAGFNNYINLQKEALLLALKSRELLSKPLQTPDEACHTRFWMNSFSNWTMSKSWWYNCICKTWYDWNKDDTGCELINVKVQKKDSNDDSWNELQNAILWMYNYGLTKYNWVSEYRGNDQLTREQASKFFVEYSEKYLEVKIDTSKDVSFSDLNEADYTLQPFIKKASQAWLFKWVQGNFLPLNTLTRAQAVAVIMRSIVGIKDETGDYWYSEYFNKATNAWILEGLWFELYDLDSVFITRGEVALLLYRLVSE